MIFFFNYDEKSLINHIFNEILLLSECDFLKLLRVLLPDTTPVNSTGQHCNMMAAAMNAGRSLLVLLQLNKSEVKPFEICHFCLLSNYVVVRLDKNLGFHCSIQLLRK